MEDAISTLEAITENLKAKGYQVEFIITLTDKTGKKTEIKV